MVRIQLPEFTINYIKMFIRKVVQDLKDNNEQIIKSVISTFRDSTSKELSIILVPTYLHKLGVQISYMILLGVLNIFSVINLWFYWKEKIFFFDTWVEWLRT